ncbi:MAG: Gfo/Idh/MocA family oxidoreductase [Phycisphaerae bacterium]|nr:Gfo/Idh/MocA family oxidoreductase [Phycisphaerae bacterium]
MKKFRVGVIGLGMGQAHVKGFQSHPQAEVVAVADIDKVKLAERADDFGIAGRYTNALDMLKKENLDVVSIATPNKFHKPLTLAAFKAGCHVLCEKPMAMNAREAGQMLEASKKAKKRLMINFSFRFTDQSYALKQATDSGILGDVYFARTVWHRRRGIPGFNGGKFGEAEGMGSWFYQKELSGGGPLIDLGVHRLDLALWLMNYPKPVWVMGSTYDHIASRLAKKQKRKQKYTVEDIAVAMIKFENGATLELEASWAANTKKNEEMETRLFGTDAGLVQRNIGEGYDFEAEIYLEREGCQYDMKLHPPVPAAQNAMFHFIESIRENKPHTATGREGHVVMQILDAIYASAKKNAPVRIKL